MQKVVKDNIIYVEKPKMSMVPLALSAASLLFIILGAASLFYLQKPLQQVQETRDAASIGNGQVELTSQLASSSNYTQGVPSVINLNYDAKGIQLTGIQIVVKVEANAETPLIEIPASSNLQAIFQEVQQTTDGYLVSVIVTSKTLGGSFTTNGATSFAKVTVPLHAAGQIKLTYDKNNSFATVANTTPPQDELRTPTDAVFTISPVINSTPSPSLSPSLSPSPSLIPAASPTSQPPAIPSGNDFWPVSSSTVVTFWTNDSNHAQVAQADLKPYQTYRIRVHYQIQNNLKSSEINLSPVTSAFVVNGQGSSYVSDTMAYSLISNHADGAGNTVETVFSTLPTNTLRITVDSTNTYSETNEGNNIYYYTFTASAGSNTSPPPTTSGLNRTCNEYCADSRECAANYTCFYNKCRRPNNPDSGSCSVPTVTVISAIVKSCNAACSSNIDCAVNLRCYQGSCRLATNPSSLSCSATTAAVITTGSGTSLVGEKGEEIPFSSVLPSSTPGPLSSIRPSASPFASVKPGATPSPTAGIHDTDSTPRTQSFWSAFLTRLQERGISLPLIAVALGLILFVLALLFAILSRLGRREPPTVIGGVKNEPQKPSPYEDELQRKINSLKSKEHVPLVVKAPGLAPSGAPPSVYAMQELQAQKLVVTGPPKDTPATSMMNKLRDRGVLDHMPQTPKNSSKE